MPPGGFFYAEVELKWKTPNPFLPISMIAQQLQTVRIQNARAGLDPTYGACLKAIDDYTCARLGHSASWCVQEQSQLAQTARRNERVKKQCGSCGRK